MILAHLRGRDVWRNLAAEEWLLERSAVSRVLLFYVNDPAVVIGRHQNPWAETDPAALEAGDVRLARRTSGGGAVWHDGGVLNYSFLLPRREYRRPELMETVRRALARLGFNARVEQDTSLFVGARKISGHAFRLRGDLALHHGTLLISADLTRLRAALTPVCRIRTSAAIASIRAPVMNLVELDPRCTAEMCIEAIAAEVSRLWGPIEQVWDERDLDEVAIRTLTERHRSWSWQYGETPPFTAEFSSATDAAAAELWLADVREGRLVALQCESRPLLLPEPARALLGHPFDPPAILAILRRGSPSPLHVTIPEAPV